MSISKLDLMRLAQAYDGEFSLADFSPEEIEELLNPLDKEMTVEDIRRRYFEFYDYIKDRTLYKHKCLKEKGSQKKRRFNRRLILVFFNYVCGKNRTFCRQVSICCLQPQRREFLHLYNKFALKNAKREAEPPKSRKN